MVLAIRTPDRLLTSPALLAGAFCCKSRPMSDRKALAREIAARTTPRFIEIKKEKKDHRPIVLGPDEMRLVEKSVSGYCVSWKIEAAPKEKPRYGGVRGSSGSVPRGTCGRWGSAHGASIATVRSNQFDFS